jgi:hypothetical protein
LSAEYSCHYSVDRVALFGGLFLHVGFDVWECSNGLAKKYASTVQYVGRFQGFRQVLDDLFVFVVQVCVGSDEDFGFLFVEFDY